MSRFTEKEIAYVRSQRLGRMATVNAKGDLHVVPVGFSTTHCAIPSRLSEPATLFVPPTQLRSFTSAITPQPTRPTHPKQSKIVTSRGISRRAVLLGAGAVVGVGLVGIRLLAHTPAVTTISSQLPSPRSIPTPTLAPTAIPLGTVLFTYHGHSGYVVYAVAWSPDGKRIASTSTDTTVQVWDAANGGNVLTYRGHTSSVEAVTWSPDGRRIASASTDQSVKGLELILPTPPSKTE